MLDVCVHIDVIDYTLPKRSSCCCTFMLCIADEPNCSCNKAERVTAKMLTKMARP